MEAKIDTATEDLDAFSQAAQPFFAAVLGLLKELGILSRR